MVMRMLPVPDFFDPARVGEVWRVPYQERAAQAASWARTHGLRPAADDRRRVALVVVDAQNTFCVPGFELFVAGRSGTAAVDDNVRLCQFIYRHLDLLTQIFPTLDTHTPIQIFHPAFWVNASGEHPAPYTLLEADDVRRGRWRVHPAAAGRIAAALRPADAGETRTLEWLQAYAQHYTDRLERSGKYRLTIWPYHALLGGIGHALVSAVDEAVFFHARARASRPGVQPKGDHPLTEHYSALRPEVMEDQDGRPIAGKNAAFIQTLLAFDAVIIAGQAKSHCVAWTVEDLLAEIAAVDPALARKVYLLEDCTSPVVVPGVIDYTAQAEAAVERFRAAGMHVVRSTEPPEEWPGFPAEAR